MHLPLTCGKYFASQGISAPFWRRTVNPPVELPGSLAAWGTPDFNVVLKSELEGLRPDALPLQAGLSRGSHVSGDWFEAMIIAAEDDRETIRATVGIHYRSIIAGCSCADDPTPVDELAEYCEVGIEIEKATARMRISLRD